MRRCRVGGLQDARIRRSDRNVVLRAPPAPQARARVAGRTPGAAVKRRVGGADANARRGGPVFLAPSPSPRTIRPVPIPPPVSRGPRPRSPSTLFATGGTLDPSRRGSASINRRQAHPAARSPLPFAQGIGLPRSRQGESRGAPRSSRRRPPRALGVPAGGERQRPRGRRDQSQRGLGQRRRLEQGVRPIPAVEASSRPPGGRGEPGRPCARQVLGVPRGPLREPAGPRPRRPRAICHGGGTGPRGIRAGARRASLRGRRRRRPGARGKGPGRGRPCGLRRWQARERPLWRGRARAAVGGGPLPETAGALSQNCRKASSGAGT